MFVSDAAIDAWKARRVERKQERERRFEHQLEYECPNEESREEMRLRRRVGNCLDCNRSLCNHKHPHCDLL